MSFSLAWFSLLWYNKNHENPEPIDGKAAAAALGHVKSPGAIADLRKALDKWGTIAKGPGASPIPSRMKQAGGAGKKA
jgi:hypothetical protein